MGNTSNHKRDHSDFILSYWEDNSFSHGRIIAHNRVTVQPPELPEDTKLAADALRIHAAVKIQANYRGYVVRRDKWDTLRDKHKEAITDDDKVSLHLLSVFVGYGWDFMSTLIWAKHRLYANSFIYKTDHLKVNLVMFNMDIFSLSHDVASERVITPYMKIDKRLEVYNIM